MVCLGEGFATQKPLPSKVGTVLQEPVLRQGYLSGFSSPLRMLWLGWKN
jgi:hypothetical protein